MTRPLKRSFTLLFTTLVGSLLLLSPLTAYAADHDLRIATELYNQRSGSAKVDITNNYFEKFLSSLNSYSANDPDKNRAALERDYKKAQEQGTIVLLQNVSSDSGHVRMYFNYSRDCGISLTRDSHGYMLRINSNSDDCKFRGAAFDANPVANYYGNSVSRLTGGFYVSSASVSIYAYTGDYSVADSAKGAPKLPNGKPKPEAGSSSIEWNDNCGLDVGCHLGNLSNAVKHMFDLVSSLLDFSENNPVFKVLRNAIVPPGFAEGLNTVFSALTTPFKQALAPMLATVDLLKSGFNTLFPPVNYWNYSNYCTTSLVGDAGNQDSAGHRYLFQATVFGAKFSPDICSFERAIGGHTAMQRIRVFTSTALVITALFIWYFFLNRILGERF